MVRAMWDEFLRGGFPEHSFSDDVEWHPAPDEPESGPDSSPSRGPEQIREMLASWWEVVTEPWVKADEFLDCGDRVVVCWRGGGLGRVSRVPVEWEEHARLHRPGRQGVPCPGVPGEGGGAGGVWDCRASVAGRAQHDQTAFAVYFARLRRCAQGHGFDGSARGHDVWVDGAVSESAAVCPGTDPLAGPVGELSGQGDCRLGPPGAWDHPGSRCRRRPLEAP